MESILGLIKSLKIRALDAKKGHHCEGFIKIRKIDYLGYKGLTCLRSTLLEIDIEI
jgi:hypothetical protein